MSLAANDVARTTTMVYRSRLSGRMDGYDQDEAASEREGAVVLCGFLAA